MEDTRGFLDKAKAAMSQAAAKAKEEVEDLQARHDLGNAEKELGKLAFDLVEAGELEHPALEEAADRVRELRSRIEGDGEEAEPDAEEPEAEADEPADADEPDEPVDADKPVESDTT